LIDLEIRERRRLYENCRDPDHDFAPTGIARRERLILFVHNPDAVNAADRDRLAEIA
jgi:hypothetical protein